MEVSAVLGFAVVAVALIVVPGPDWAHVLAAGVHDRAVVPAVTGLLIGYALVTAVVAAGVGPLVAAVPRALLGLTVVGACYLTLLGVRTLRSPGLLRAGAAGGPPVSPRRHLARGIGVSALNPKGLLIFVAILPQFARTTAAWPVWVQLVALGGVFVALCAAFYLLLGLAAHRVLRARPGLAAVAGKVAGAAMVVVGVGLLAERGLPLA